MGLQVGERVWLPPSAAGVPSKILVMYEGDDVWSLENTDNGQEITLHRSELYDACKLVFARDSRGYTRA